MLKTTRRNSTDQVGINREHVVVIDMEDEYVPKTKKTYSISRSLFSCLLSFFLSFSLSLSLSLSLCFSHSFPFSMQLWSYCLSLIPVRATLVYDMLGLIPFFFKLSVHDQARARQEVGPSYPQSLTLQVFGRHVFARPVLAVHPEDHPNVTCPETKPIPLQDCTSWQKVKKKFMAMKHEK